MTHIIYGLYDPRVEPRMIRYVGYSGKGLQKRLREHCSEARQSSACHRTKWIGSLLRDGVTPEIVELECVSQSTWRERERHWIATLRTGGKLTNSTDGGEGLINPTQDVRDRIAAKVSVISKGNQYRKGIPHSEADRAKISAGLLASSKVRESAAARKGVNAHARMSPEQRAAKIEKIRQGKLGKRRAPFSEQARRNMSLGHVGVKHTTEQRAKISDSLRVSAAFKEAMMRQKGSRRGPQSPEHLLKLSQARLGRRMITDGALRKYLSQGEPLPNGWNFVRPT